MYTPLPTLKKHASLLQSIAREKRTQKSSRRIAKTVQSYWPSSMSNYGCDDMCKWCRTNWLGKLTLCHVSAGSRTSVIA
ncbi:hypothetical protein VTI28DRAFT_7240 [Corynascus sepedonium]